MKKLTSEKTGRTWCVPAWSDVAASIESGDSIGYCVKCGAEHYGIEPDADKSPCEECEKPAVYGAENILLMGLYHH